MEKEDLVLNKLHFVYVGSVLIIIFLGFFIAHYILDTNKNYELNNVNTLCSDFNSLGYQTKVSESQYYSPQCFVAIDYFWIRGNRDLYNLLVEKKVK